MTDFERIVNKNADVRSFAREREANQKRDRRLKMMLVCICALAFVAISTVIFGAIGAVHYLLAAVVSVISAMAACFALGLYMEMVKSR